MLTVILAGGLGTRLRSVLNGRPKTMAPVNGRPFLEYLLCALRAQGVLRATIAIGYGGDQVRTHFATGSRLGIGLTYSDEGQRLLGTAGAVRRVLEMSAGVRDEAVLVLNGDTYVEFDLSALQAELATRGATMAMVVARVDDASRYGTVELNATGAVSAFGEKRFAGPGLVNAGVYYAQRHEWWRMVAGSEVGSLERDILPTIVGQGLQALITGGSFVDIGVPDDYRRAGAVLSGRLGACQ